MKKLSSIERVRLARRRRDVDMWRTLYGYLTVISSGAVLATTWTMVKLLMNLLKLLEK